MKCSKCLNARHLLLLFAVSVCASPWVSAVENVDLQAEKSGEYFKLTTERLELARRTLAFVATSAEQPRLAAELAALEQRIKTVASSPGAFPKSLYDETCELRRRIILSHPLLDFDRLLINKRPPPK
ncbi:MAG: hypothetical protein QGF59_29855, partial [Pirellulaceae bacterium]|nr:hypothetical protein [Pirellulaceae bacterium]